MVYRLAFSAIAVVSANEKPCGGGSANWDQQERYDLQTFKQIKHGEEGVVKCVNDRQECLVDGNPVNCLQTVHVKCSNGVLTLRDGGFERCPELPERPHLLPDSVVPNRYDLSLNLDLELLRLEGEVSIKVEIKEPVQMIRLNAHELTISSASITDGTSPLFMESKSFDETYQEVDLHFQTIQKGTWTLKLEFSGTITAIVDEDAHYGLYRQEYEVQDCLSGMETKEACKQAGGHWEEGSDPYHAQCDVNCYKSRKQHVAATQFGEVYARKVFPCFDQPDLKAEFNLTLHVDETLTALFNTPQHSSSVANGIQTVRFKTTPKMSTYLLAFAVGKFDKISGSLNNGTPVTLYTVRQKEMVQAHSRVNEALDHLVKMMDTMNDKFWPDPMEKIDAVAIPVFIGGMENWGLITLNERIVFRAWKNTIQHEVIHNWFGNLVTCKWWDDWWLNEGFATYLSYYYPSLLYPEENIMENFAMHTGWVIRKLDNHPIKTFGRSINAVTFEKRRNTEIAYRKAASLIHMVRLYMGDELFEAGLKQYLQQNKYGSATSSDLWTALQQVGLRDNLQSIFDPWIKQSGFPVMLVKQDGMGFTVSQRKYQRNSDQASSDMWPIPLFLDGSNNIVLLESATKKVNAMPFTDPIFPIFTIYCTESYKTMAPQVHTFAVSRRRLLLRDAYFNLKDNDLEGMTLAATLLSGYKQEIDSDAWWTISEILTHMKTFAVNSSEKRYWRSFVSELSASYTLSTLNKQFQPRGWQEPTFKRVSKYLAYSMDQRVISKVRDIFRGQWNDWNDMGVSKSASNRMRSAMIKLLVCSGETATQLSNQVTQDQYDAEVLDMPLWCPAWVSIMSNDVDRILTVDAGPELFRLASQALVSAAIEEGERIEIIEHVIKGVPIDVDSLKTFLNSFDFIDNQQRTMYVDAARTLALNEESSNRLAFLGQL